MNKVKVAKKALNSPSDKVLVAKAQEGDTRAFKQIYDRYHNLIVHYLYKFLHDYQAAEDLAQETFILVHKHLPEYEHTGKLSSWIYKIAGNLAKNRLRNTSREKCSLFSTPIKNTDEKIELGDIIPDRSYSPLSKASGKEFRMAFKKAIGSITPKYREVFLLCEVEGLSYQETARVLHCSPTNVGARLCRARKMIQDKIKPEEYF